MGRPCGLGRADDHGFRPTDLAELECRSAEDARPEPSALGIGTGAGRAERRANRRSDGGDPRPRPGRDNQCCNAERADQPRKGAS